MTEPVRTRTPALIQALLPTLFLVLATLAGNVNAHAPHDVATIVAVSPDFSNDGTVFGRVKLTDHEMFVRSTDFGRSWDVWAAAPIRHNVQNIVFSPGYAADGTAFMATVKGGCWKSVDRGETWVAVNVGIEGLIAHRVVVSPDFAADGRLAVTTSAGVFLSDDGAANWLPAGPGLTETNIQGLAFAPAPAGPLVLFAGSKTLHRSDDGGASWTVLSTFSLSLETITPSRDYANDLTLMVAFGRFGGGIDVSTDGGASFAPSTGLPELSVNDIVVADDGTIFCATGSSGVGLATDPFGPWSMSTLGFEPLTNQTNNHYLQLGVSPDYGNDHTVFVAAYEGMHVTTDGALAWVQADIYSQLVHKRVRFSPDYRNNGTIWFGNYGGGMFEFRDPRKLPLGPAANPGATAGGAAMRSSGSAPVPGSTGSPAGSAAPGSPGTPASSWSVRSDGLGNLYCVSLTPSPFVDTDDVMFYGFAGLWNTTDAGQAWSSVGLPPGITIIRDVAFSPTWDIDLVVFASTSLEDQLRSVDGGQTWQPLTGGLPPDLKVLNIGMSPDFDVDGTVFLASQNKGVWRTQDGGQNWSEINVGLDNLALRAFAVAPTFLTDGLALGGSIGSGLYRTDNGGDTWAPSNAGLPDGGALIIEDIAFSPDFDIDGTVFIGTGGHGVFKSVDSGVNWSAVGPGLPRSSAKTLAVSPDFARDQTLVVCTYAWVWRSEDGGVSWQPLPGFQRIDDNHQKVISSLGHWSETAQTDAFGQKVSSADGTGSFQELEFFGDSVSWYAARSDNAGIAEVFVDEVSVAVLDLYAATAVEPEVVFHTDFGTADWHTLEVRVTGTGNGASSGTVVVSDGYAYTF